ncbi:MAG TPA: DUF1254 domain-containing protein [Spongiibacteraceae bacterium]|nr:DUF1254 domain-containing protein [Spongiibacteraceae bacterium]
MRAQTTPNADPHGVYAPINQLFSQAKLAAPGGLYAGRGPNNDTLYFTGWLDLRDGPVVIDAPDTHDRYYALTYADFYSEVQHTGRRTTGTKAQHILIAGPEWQGDVPAGMQLIRLKTQLGYILGRVLVNGANDTAAVKALIAQFKMHPLVSDLQAKSSPLESKLPTATSLTSLDFFQYLNEFLQDNPRVPGEEGLMAQFDLVGIGPQVQFDAARLSSGTRKGFERALIDGRRILSEAAYGAANKGWSPIRQLYGAYGFNYLSRAITEYNGFLGNLPEESAYPSISFDQAGEILTGAKAYRLIFARGSLPPVDAFWSLTAYDMRTVDLIPNSINRYSLGDRTPNLKYKSDGSIEIRLQKNAPLETDVNWLPVGDGPFFLTLRLYQPKAAALSGEYHLPAVEVLP